MDKVRLSTKHVFIVLWVLWAMFCVRFGFRIGLIGSAGAAGSLSTVLFTIFFCALIPLSFLFFRKDHLRRLIYAGLPCALAGIVFAFISPRLMPFSASLLAAASAFFTAAFLYLYTFDLTLHEQIAVIILFLFAKPLFSFSAVFLSGYAGKEKYIYFLAAILACIAFTPRFLPSSIQRPGGGKKTSFQASPGPALAGIYILFVLIILERMNGAFTLFAAGLALPESYSYYFIGGLGAALAAWWIFIRKNQPVSFAYNFFLFAALIHFVFNLAAFIGLRFLNGPGMLFFGLSDIVYVFLFSTAASISSAYGKKVFMGFVLIFGFALLGGFGLSYFLYDYFQDLFGTVYALVSLLMLAVSFLLAPLLRSVTGRIASDSVTRCDSKKAPHCTHVLSCLTTRENEIVHFYLEGYSNQQIAEALHIAPSTVKVHSRNIYEKLNIKSRIELIFLFQKKQEEK